MDYAGTPYPALTDTDTLYDVKAYSEALRAALIKGGSAPPAFNFNGETMTRNLFIGTAAISGSVGTPPVATPGHLETIINDNYGIQRYTVYNSGAAIYTRTSTYMLTGWNSWRLV